MNLLDMVDLVNLVDLMDLVNLMNLEILVTWVNLVDLIDLANMGQSKKKLSEQQDLSRKNFPDKVQMASPKRMNFRKSSKGERGGSRGEREFPFPTFPGNTSLPFPFPKVEEEEETLSSQTQ